MFERRRLSREFGLSEDRSNSSSMLKRVELHHLEYTPVHGVYGLVAV